MGWSKKELEGIVKKYSESLTVSECARLLVRMTEEKLAEMAEPVKKKQKKIKRA